MPRNTTCRLRSALLLAAWLLPIALVSGQDRRREPPIPFPFNNPDQFFQQFLAGPSAEDEQALQAISISRAEEFQFGNQMYEAYLADLRRRKLTVVTRGKEVEYLERLAAQLRPFMQNAGRYRQITVHVVDSPEIDARSFPGGKLFFFRGMLDLAGSEAALVGVLGHELSHLDHGHQLVPLKQSKLLEQTFTAGPGGFDVARFMTAGTTMARLMSRPFRPQDEVVADRDGTDWCFRAGYDPRELSQLLIRMHDRARGPGLALPAFLQTHPPSLDRSDAVLRRFAELQRAEPRAELYVGRTNLVRRETRLEQRYED